MSISHLRDIINGVGVCVGCVYLNVSSGRDDFF